MRPAIRIADVTYGYPDGPPVLEEFSLDIGEGEFLLLTGPSGSGKSTILRLINGLIPHFAGGRFKGRVTCMGADTRDAGTRALSADVGFVFQDPESQFIMSSVESEMAFGLENRMLPPKEIGERIGWAAKRLGISHLVKRDVETLSGGQKQMAMLAAVLSGRPKILVLDEPTSQLDPSSAATFLNAISSLHHDGMTVVMAEHRMERVLHHADTILETGSMMHGPVKEMIPSLPYLPPVTSLALRLNARGHDIIPPLDTASAKEAFDGIKVRQRGMPSKGTGKPLITMSGVTKSHSGIQAIADIDLTVCEGEFIGIFGPNGSGKTTLVSHMNGLLLPDKGEVISFSRNTRDLDPADLSGHIGYVSQNPNEYLFNDTLRDELAFTLRCHKKEGDIGATLSKVGLCGLEERYPRDISGGERQLAAIASILVAEPQMLIFDEPTRGVDPAQKAELMSFLAGLWKGGKTVVIVTHDVEAAAGWVQRAIVVKGGKIAADGPPSQALADMDEMSPSLGRSFPEKNLLTVEQVMEALI